MIDMDNLYKKFSEALPENLELTEEKKREAFDYIYKICYISIMEEDDFI